MANADAIKPHAIMVEFLYQGHITPFIHLAIALASKGCIVTYVQTEYTHHLMSKSNPQKQSDFLFSGAHEAGLDIRCTTISDGFPLDFDRSLNFVKFYESILLDFPARIDELVGKIVAFDQEGGAGLRPFLVADTSYLWPPAVAAKHGIVNVSFWVMTALHLSIGHHLELLKENGLLKSYGEYNDDVHDIPGVKVSSVREHMKCALIEDEFLPQILKNSVMKANLQVKKADFVLCNTVEELEWEVVSGLNQKFPTYAIGPTNFSTKISIPGSLRPATDCTEWLSSKPPRSVLFIAFGSLAPADKEDILEMAGGLSISGVYFLWVIRPDQAVVPPPPGDRGLVVPWCNQREVLANPAIAGFLTHCGWNSLMESMWFGVPLICYPIFMDQPVNRNLVVDEWKIGINLCDKEPVSKEGVAEKISKFMSCSEELRSEMENLSKIVHGALATNGSSNNNLDKFLHDLKAKICS
ncbi:hypothetical protein ACS0TY_025671 [Phlomoides rotata]